MATRTIVTSQPDVACDVCERRLLRGEQPDVYLAAGRRRTVCELCAPRAAHEGWRRESDAQSLSLPPMRPRRGRSLFDRLKQVARPAEELAPMPAEPQAAEGRGQRAQPSYDFLDSYAPGAGEEDGADAETPAAAQSATSAHEPPDESTWFLERAVQLFNASEFPRRVAGVARSLGVPEISVQAAEHLGSVVRILVAWELCWYRYEVDMSVENATVEAIGQGTELSELSREERVANALAADTGELQFTGPA